MICRPPVQQYQGGHHVQESAASRSREMLGFVLSARTQEGFYGQHGADLFLCRMRAAKNCAVAKKTNADRNSALCFTACLRTGVLRSSDDILCNFERGLSPQRRWEHAPCVRNWNINSLHLRALLNPVLWDDLQDFDNSVLNLRDWNIDEFVQ